MILQGNALDVLRTGPDESIQCCVTSPPYWGLRDYGVEGQIGLEKSPEEYVANLVEIFREVRRVLRSDGTLWLNLGDSYAGSRAGTRGVSGQMVDRSVAASRCRVRGETRVAPLLKHKDLVGIPWRVAFALQADGWYLRSDIVWAKSNPMPESVRDRPTKAHEYLFLLSKSPRYFYDADAIAEDAVTAGVPNGEVKSPYGQGFTAGRSGNKARKLASGDGRSRLDTHMGSSIPWEGVKRNARSVWTISTKPYKEAHFATFPEELPRRCILAGTSEAGCCEECGAPWKRVVQRIFVPQQDVRDPKKLLKSSNKGLDESSGWGSTPRGTTESNTLGWESSCSCTGDTLVPCTVLDPFGGAGTTELVAAKLGRMCVSIDLNPAYNEIAKRRLEKR